MSPCSAQTYMILRFANLDVDLPVQSSLRKRTNTFVQSTCLSMVFFAFSWEISGLLAKRDWATIAALHERCTVLALWELNPSE